MTPLSNGYTAAGSIALYLTIIFSLRALLQSVKARRRAGQRSQNGHANGTKGGVDAKQGKEKPVIPASYLKYPFLLHNVLLSAGSGWLLALMLEEVLPIWSRNGAFYSICGEGAWTMRLETFYIINYYM